MAAPLGIATTNTTASFVFNNIQAVEYGSNSGNSNSVVAIPNVQALDAQSATFMAGKQPGGVAFRQPSNTVLTAPGNTNAALIMLDGMETTAARLGYTKNGAFIVVCNGTNSVTVPLTNTQTNTNSFAGDTAFATIYQACVYNLSGLDGNNSASATVGASGTNGCNLFGLNSTNGTLNNIKVDGASRKVTESTNGVTVNAANTAIIITPTANSTIGVVLMGS